MELVRLALEQEGSVAALARQHDVNDNLLLKWIRLCRRGEATAAEVSSQSGVREGFELHAGGAGGVMCLFRTARG